MSIPPPDNVKVKVHGSGKVLVTWQQSSVRKLTGYEVWLSVVFDVVLMCLQADFKYSTKCQLRKSKLGFSVDIVLRVLVA